MAIRSITKSLLLAFLLLSTPVFAQQDWKSYDFFGLTGGLVDGPDSTAISPKEASDLQNVIFDESGGIEKRSGFTPISSSATCSGLPVNGVFMYKQAVGDRYLVAVCSDGTVRKMDYGGITGPDKTWDDVTGSLPLGVDQNDVPDFATVQNVLVFTDGLGTNPPYTWNAVGNIAQLSGAPNASMLEFHNRILWVAGRTDDRSCVQFSELDDYTTWTTTNCTGSGDYILVETDDNQIITGLKSAFDCLYVFKTESIHRVCGRDRDNLRLEQMVSGIGAASNTAIQVINNRIVFLTSQGDVAIYDGGINLEFISYKIDGTLNSDVINFSRLQYARSAFLDDSEFYLSLSKEGSGTHNLILMYDVDIQAWTKFDGINANALAVYEIGSQERAIAFGDYNGFVHQYPFGTSDNGSNIEAFYQSGDIRFDIAHQKTFRAIQLFLREQGSYSITVEHSVDYDLTPNSQSISLSGSGAVWDTAVWDTDIYSDTTTLIYIIPIDYSGEFFRWKVKDTSTNPPFLVRGLRLWLYEDTDALVGTVVP